MRCLPLATVVVLCLLGGFARTPIRAQEENAAPVRGSVIEDRAARKLVDAGDVRYEANEVDKAVEIWESVIERYPRSRVRFDAHLRLGEYYLDKQRAFDRARGHFEMVAGEDNPDDDKRAEATLKTGVCFYENRHYGQCFKVFRDVIEEFPTSSHVNHAYYYIGLAHFKQGHYSRAIDALEKVGTNLTDEDVRVEKVEAGKRLYLRIDDKDLAILEAGEKVKVECVTKSGDKETVECHPVGRNVRVVLGSLPTKLGKPASGNGTLEVRGGDTIDVTYVDEHTADMKFNQKRLREVIVVGSATVQIMDGSFHDNSSGVVLGKEANVQITDADFDRTDRADSLKAVVEVWRPKTKEELDTETTDAVAATAAEVAPDTVAPAINAGEIREQIERHRKIDSIPLTLTEARANPEPVVAEVEPEAEQTQPVDDGSVRTGIFRGGAPVRNAGEPVAGDEFLQAQSGDQIRVVYLDEVNITKEARRLQAEAKCVEGNLGDVRVTKSKISDEELRIRTRLRTASALTHIGNHYKEFGLDEKSQIKYGEALQVCEEITADARRLGGSILEETYVQLWRIYFAMDNLNLALAMSQRLMREFPDSSFIDEAILSQARVARKRGELGRAISLFASLVRLEASPLRGEGQFGIAECYEEMALAAPADGAEPLFERAFLEYQKVYEQFPDSGRVGEAVAKMANFYYQKKDYARAVDVFENVLTDYPDANFVDVILFNYGRCLYRLGRKGEARKQFDHLITDYPESALAEEAKKITDALSKAAAASANAETP